MEDNRSKRFVFVPFCALCQAFQAKGIVRYEWKGSISPIIEELLKGEVNMIQMPCPESHFEGFEKGLKRDPRGFGYYNNQEFIDLCRNLTADIVKMIKAITNNNYEVLAILGIEMSPSCAVNYQYSNKGLIKKPGIFLDILQKELAKEKIKIKFIGINRKFVNKSLKELKETLKNDLKGNSLNS